MVETLPKQLLHRKLVVFADFENVFCNTDPFVLATIHNIHEAAKGNPKENTTIFRKLNQTYMEIAAATKQYISCVKTVPNVIEYLMDEDEILSYVDCDEIKNAILYADYKTTISKDITLTKLGRYVSQLSNSDRVTEVYIYCKQVTQAIHDLVFSFFHQHDDKVNLVDGDRSGFFEQKYCDCYFIEHVDELYAICNTEFQRELPAEVYIPEFPFNLDEHDKLQCFDNPMNILKEYNVAIHTVALPII